MPQEDSLFQALIATAVDGIMVIDSRGTVEVYGGACERLFGYKPDQVLGQNVSMLMPEPYRSAHDGYIGHYVDTGEKRIIGIGREVQGRRQDGTIFPMYLSVGEGTLRGRRIFVGIVHDISDRKERDSKITELQSELLHVTRLTVMGQLASALAHELNQPLAAILNYVNTAKLLAAKSTDPMGPRFGELLDKAAEQAGRAGQIIRRLRDFLLRRESERSLEDINAIVEEAAALSLVGATERGVVTRRDFADDLPPVSVDRIQIQQVLVNILRNAMEAMQESAIRQLTLTTSRQDGDFVAVAISDTGSGMSDEVARRLFEPFVTTKERGMGFGLSISRSIIEEHGGRIWAEPNPSGGTIFRFRLPTAEGEDDGV
jgi:two-component system sensor kinase FixL